MVCLQLECFAILLFLSMVHARPGGTAYHGQQDNVTPSEPSDRWTAPYESPNYGPDPTTRFPDDAQTSNRPIGSNAYRQSTWGSASHSSEQPSYPLYYNSSATLGPTAAYGTAGSSGCNFSRPQRTAGPLDVTNNCPPPSTVTIEKTVSALPLTVTITSTITSNPEPSSQITPTVTITVTSTVCGLNGEITGVASNGSSAAISKGGEQGSGGEAFTGTGGSPEFPSKPASEPAPIVQTSPAIRPIDTQSFPQATGTGAGAGAPAQSYQPSFTNATASVGLSFPIATGTYQPSTVSDILPLNIEQPHITGLLDGQAQHQPSVSKVPGSGEAAPNPTTLPPVAPYPSSGNASESQHTSLQYTGPMIDIQDGGQGAGSTQVAPSLSSAILYGSGSAVPINKITSQQGSGNVPPVSSASASTKTNPMHPTTSIIPPFIPDTSIKPPFVNATAPQPSIRTSGTGGPYQPATGTAPASTFSPAPFQTPMYPVVPDSATTLAVDDSVPASGSTATSQMPTSLPPVYATVTQEVIPIPLTTTGKNVPSFKLYGNFFGNGDAKATSANWATAQGTTTPGPSMDGSSTFDKDQDTTLAPAPMTTSPETSVPVPIPTTTSPPTTLPPPQSGIPFISSPVPPSNSAPVSSSAPPPPPPPPSPTTTKPTTPSCPPPNNPITADFNTFKRTLPPLPAPYLSLNYTGFTLSNGSPTPHLTSPASSPIKSISIAPPGSAFNLSSIALACAAPPCNITMWGQSVPGAARALLTNKVLVEAGSEGAQPYTVVEGLAERGWVGLESVSFRVGEGGGGGEMAVDNVVYTVEGGEAGCG